MSEIRHFIPNKLSEAQMHINKEVIVNLLLSTHRAGIENAIKYLDKTPFFKAPNSIWHSHHMWPGGLAQHSLGVARLMMEYPGIDRESAILVGLLHDICKADVLEYNQHLHRWTSRKNLHIKGHGTRSVRLLTSVLKLQLSKEEYLAIRYHMHRQTDDDKTNRSLLHTAIVECDKLNTARQD